MTSLNDADMIGVMAPNRLSQKRPPTKLETFRSYAFAIGLALTIRWGIAEAYVIPSGSMLPTLLLHDHIFVNKLVYGLRVPFSKAWLARFSTPSRGEIIVFKHPKEEGTFLIKRIIGVAGDKIQYDGRDLIINGAHVDASTAGSVQNWNWLTDRDLENNKEGHDHFNERLGKVNHSILLIKGENSPDSGAFTVPPESLFVMGDHRDNSADSRFWGFVPVDNILGRAMFVWMTCENPLPLVGIACDPRSMRWGRIGHVIR